MAGFPVSRSFNLGPMSLTIRVTIVTSIVATFVIFIANL